MKTIYINRLAPSAGKRAVWCGGLMLMGFLSIAQVKQQPAPGFEIISRQSVTGDKTGRFSLSAGTNAATYKVENKQGKQVYNIQANGVQATVPALSAVEVARNSGRIWVYGDSMHKHVVQEAYVNVYTTTGSLVKSLGKIGIQPFSVTIADNGSFVFAGNSGKDIGKLSPVLALYDLNGSKRWQASLPEALPSEVYTAPDNQYTAVVLYVPQDHRSSILFYNASGQLLYTLKGSATAIEFLPSKKVVICDGNAWAVYDLSAGLKLLHTGTLPGVTIGRFPVMVHPSRDIFFILSLNTASKGVSLQAYDAHTGSLLAQGGFEGKGYWQSFRQVTVTPDGNIQLGTESEVITLKMK